MCESFHGGMRKTKQDSTDLDDLPIVHRAARDGDEEVLRNVIQTSQDLLNQFDNLGLTPVIQATIAKSIHCLKILLENNASPNEKDEQGNSPLMYSISREWFEGSKLLLEHGAKISTQDQNRRNAVHLVICCKDLSIPRMILRCASFSDVNQADVEGMTPVHWAAFHNWSEQLRILLDSSGDPSIKDKEGKTALHWAAQNGSVACIQHLLLGWEDRDLINLRDLEGRAPIHLAAAAGHLDVVFELAQSPGCDTESRDREGRTALHWACAMNKHRAVAGLLRLGVSYDSRDNHNATPLTYAKQANHKSCTDLLMNFDPLNPQRTLIPVDNPSDQKVDFRSTESKKMKFSENIDFNCGKVVDALTYSVKQCRSRLSSQEETLDGLNSALDGIMACQIQGKDQYTKDCNGNVVDTQTDKKEPSDKSTSLALAEVPMSDGLSNGYSSDEDSRYLPQMAVSPPNMASPDLSESEDESFLDIHSSNAASVGVKLHRPVSKKDSSSSNTSTGTQSYILGPLRKKEVPDYLRVHSTGSDSHDMPPLKNQRVELAPLKVRREQTSQSPTTASLLGSASRLMSRESQREVLSPQERPVGLRKKSLSLNQEVASAGADNGMKTLSRSKSYGFSISKSEPSVLPSIKPRGIMSHTTDNFFRSSNTRDNGAGTLRAATNKEEKKRLRLQQPRK